jgi:hypothetical protein
MRLSVEPRISSSVYRLRYLTSYALRLPARQAGNRYELRPSTHFACSGRPERMIVESDGRSRLTKRLSL